MAMTHMSGPQIRQAIEAAKRTLDGEAIRRDIGLQLAADHNIRRKINMIDSLNQLYGYLHGNGEAPAIMASRAFNPFEGQDRTNIYYMFKELRKGMPWELRRDYLVLPAALTIVMLDLANHLFPSPTVSAATLTFQGFLNLITLPVDRSGISQWEAADKKRHYMHQLDIYEEKLTTAYENLSTHFAAIENPNRNPVAKAVFDTDTRTKKMAAKMKLEDETRASFVAQKRAYEIWMRCRSNPAVAVKGRKPTFAAVFDYCKIALKELGLNSTPAFKKAIEAYQKRTRRSRK